MVATMDENRDPRAQVVGRTEELWVIQHSEIWKKIESQKKRSWQFPLNLSRFPRSFHGKMIVTQNDIFPTQLCKDDSLP